jgi:hypothetical protein
MQTTARTQRFDLGRLKQMTLALAVTGIAVAVAVTASVSDDGGGEGAHRVVAPQSIAVDQPVFDHRFMEQNLYLPSAGVASMIDSRDRQLFLEQNLNLPYQATSSAPDWRVLEENSWGENFVLTPQNQMSLYPSVDDVPQVRVGQVVY